MKTSSGKVMKFKSSQLKRRKLRAVVKMLSVMEPNTDSSKDPASEFLVTGRTGRRNAMPNILGTHAMTSSGDLPERLQSLCTTDKQESDAVSSSCNQGEEAGDSASTSTNTTDSEVCSESQTDGNS